MFSKWSFLSVGGLLCFAAESNRSVEEPLLKIPGPPGKVGAEPRAVPYCCLPIYSFFNGVSWIDTRLLAPFYLATGLFKKEDAIDTARLCFCSGEVDFR